MRDKTKTSEHLKGLAMAIITLVLIILVMRSMNHPHAWVVELIAFGCAGVGYYLKYWKEDEREPQD